jgi:hypothetical protein
MNSNYQWQKQQANERIQARMREAATRRLVRVDASQENSFLMRIWNRARGGVRRAGFLQSQETKRIGRRENSAMPG